MVLGKTPATGADKGARKSADVPDKELICLNQAADEIADWT